jgi:hypothetical protein
MSQEIVQALGPGEHLSELDRFTESYRIATTNFNLLLQYPFLQSIVLDDDNNGGQDLRTIVADGSGKFGQLSHTNITVARQVISFGKTIPAFLRALTISNFAINTKPMIANYIEEVDRDSEANKQFFKDVCAFIIVIPIDQYVLNYLFSSRTISGFSRARLRQWRAGLET